MAQPGGGAPSWVVPVGVAAIQAGASYAGAAAGNAASAREALLQRQFEERMSNTSWQRGTADMRAAGINPMLSFMEGGASTPGGAAAQVPNPNVLGGAVGAGVDTVSSALSAARQRRELSLLDAQTVKTKQEGDRAEAEGMLLQMERQVPRVTMPGTWWELRRQADLDLMAAQRAAHSAGAAFHGIQTARERALLPQSQYIGRNPRLTWALGEGYLTRMTSSAAQAATQLYGAGKIGKGLQRGRYR